MKIVICHVGLALVANHFTAQCVATSIKCVGFYESKFTGLTVSAEARRLKAPNSSDSCGDDRSNDELMMMIDYEYREGRTKCNAANAQ